MKNIILLFSLVYVQMYYIQVELKHKYGLHVILITICFKGNLDSSYVHVGSYSRWRKVQIYFFFHDKDSSSNICVFLCVTAQMGIRWELGGMVQQCFISRIITLMCICDYLFTPFIQPNTFKTVDTRRQMEDKNDYDGQMIAGENFDVNFLI